MNKNFTTLLLLLFCTIVYSEKALAQTEFFTVEGEVLRPLKLSMKELATFQSTEIKAKDKDGQAHIFKGVKLFDILDSAGVTLGKQLRGENLVKYVLVKAHDGYEVIFALPEIDPEFTDQTILLAYQVDGKPLAKGEGPFRLVVPNEKKHARWIREISTIKIMFIKS